MDPKMADGKKKKKSPFSAMNDVSGSTRRNPHNCSSFWKEGGG